MSDVTSIITRTRSVFFVFLICWLLLAFNDHYEHLCEIERHQLSYMKLYNSQHAWGYTHDTIHPRQV